MAEYRTFVARLNTEKDKAIIEWLEQQNSFVDFVRSCYKETLQTVQQTAQPELDLTQLAHIVRATVSSLLDEKMQGQMVGTATDKDVDLDAELGDKFDEMEF